MKCGGLHCNGCGHGGPGGFALAVVVVLIVIASAARRAVHDVVHIVSVVLEVVLLAVAAAAGLGVACLLVWAGIRVRRCLTVGPGLKRRLPVVRGLQSQLPAAARSPAAIEPPRMAVTGELGEPAVVPGRIDRD